MSQGSLNRCLLCEVPVRKSPDTQTNTANAGEGTPSTVAKNQEDAVARKRGLNNVSTVPGPQKLEAENHLSGRACEGCGPVETA